MSLDQLFRTIYNESIWKIRIHEELLQIYWITDIQKSIIEEKTPLAYRSGTMIKILNLHVAVQQHASLIPSCMENSCDKHWRFDQVRSYFYLWPYFILCWAGVCVNSIRTLSCPVLLGTHLLLRVSSGKCHKHFPILLLSCSILLLVAWSTVLGHTHFASCHLFYLSFGRVKPGLCSEATEEPKMLAGSIVALSLGWLCFTLQTSMSIFKPETVVSIAGLGNPILDFFLAEAGRFFLIFHLILDENGPSLE